MNFLRSLPLLLLLSGLGLAQPPSSPTLLLKDGLLYDGNGGPPYVADVLIQDGRIAKISRGEAPPAEATIVSLKGRALAPGFIDVHAHGAPERTPGFKNSLAMGVTTIVLGQDGSSAAPRTLKEWMQAVARRRPAVNVATLVGHGSLRRACAVPDGAPADAELREAMAALLTQGLEAGAFGLSTGLEYTPGRFADAAELRALAAVVGTTRGVVMSHVRNEDADQVVASVQELLAMCRGLDARPHVSHLKIVHGRGKEAARPLMRCLTEAWASGEQITADLYPYAASYTGLELLFPDWARPPH